MRLASESLPAFVGLLGAGGQAREIRSYLAPGTATFYAVTSRFLATGQADLVDISCPPDSCRDAVVVGAVGAPGLRRDLLAAWPGNRFTTVVSSGAHVDPQCTIDVGCVIAPGVVITTDVTIGAHCHLNIGATISHDTQLGSFVTVCPGAHIAGNVTIGDGVFVGIGANISHGVTVAPGVTIGAGATVLSDITTECAVVVGVPARVVKISEGWLNAL